MSAALAAALLFATPPPELTLIYRLEGTQDVSLAELHERVRGTLMAHTVFSVAERPRVATAEVAHCRGAPACLRAVPGLPSGQLLFVTIEAFSSSDLVVLALVDPATGAAPARRGRPAEGRPLEVIEGELPELIGTARWGSAQVGLATEPKGALARHPSGRSCTTPCVLNNLPPGPARIEVIAGSRSESVEVWLDPGQRADLTVELDESSGISPWVWVGLGVVAAAGAILAVGLSQSEPSLRVQGSEAALR